MNERVEIKPLTGVRAVAALCVFLFHMQIRWPFAHSLFLSNLLRQGAVGMSIFFVLSGFVLTHQYYGRAVSYREYFANRISRIYPVYLLAAALSLPWIGLSVTNGDLLHSSARLFVLVITNVFVIQAWFPQFFSLWNDGASWSISVEAFCYVLLPIILTGMDRATGKRLWIIAITAYLAASLPGLTFELFDNSPRIFYSLPIYRLPEFVVGVCISIAVRRGLIRPTGLVAAALVAAVVTYIECVYDLHPVYVSNNWIVMPAIGATLAFLATGRGVVVRAMSSRPVVWLGKISYSFYSLQILIILPLIYHHDGLASRIPALRNNMLLMVVSLAILVAASALAYHGIEEPARRWIRGRIGTISTKTTATHATNLA